MTSQNNPLSQTGDGEIPDTFKISSKPLLMLDEQN